MMAASGQAWSLLLFPKNAISIALGGILKIHIFLTLTGPYYPYCWLGPIGSMGPVYLPTFGWFLCWQQHTPRDYSPKVAFPLNNHYKTVASLMWECWVRRRATHCACLHVWVSMTDIGPDDARGLQGGFAKASPQRTQDTRAKIAATSWEVFPEADGCRQSKESVGDQHQRNWANSWQNFSGSARLGGFTNAANAVFVLTLLDDDYLQLGCIGRSWTVGNAAKETLFWAQKATQGLGISTPLAWASPYMDPIGVNHDVPFFGLIIPVFPVDRDPYYVSYFRIPQKTG